MRANNTNTTTILTITGGTYEVPMEVANAIRALVAPYKVSGGSVDLGKVAEPTAKKPVVKKAIKPATTDDGFDRERYESIAKQLGCFGKHGVWRCCRPIVYAVMDGQKTVKAAKAEVSKIKAANGWA